MAEVSTNVSKLFYLLPRDGLEVRWKTAWLGVLGDTIGRAKIDRLVRGEAR